MEKIKNSKKSEQFKISDSNTEPESKNIIRVHNQFGSDAKMNIISVG